MKYIKKFEVNNKNINDKLIDICANEYENKELIKIKKIKDLLSQGADINYIGIDENTPLTTAIQFGNYKMVEELLKYPNIDVNIKGTMEPNMLSNRDSAPIVIAARGSLKIVKLLLKSGADINSIGHKGITPLISAASYRMIEIMIFLIKNGADMLIQDIYGDYFSEYLTDEDIEILNKKCSEEYNRFKIEKEARKYNL